MRSNAPNAATVPDPKVFGSGRDFAAWIGLVPRGDSTGGKQKFGNGAAVLAVAGLFAEGAPQPMVIGIAACGVAAFLVAQIALRRRVKVPASAGGGSVHLQFDHGVP